jgi:hypothetical protein
MSIVYTAPLRPVRPTARPFVDPGVGLAECREPTKETETPKAVRRAVNELSCPRCCTGIALTS